MSKKISDKSVKLEDQYQLYLQLIGLRENDMSIKQKVDTKKAFMAASAQMFALLTETIAAMPNNTAHTALEYVKHQLTKFWKEQK